MSTENPLAEDGTDIDELRLRLHYINQCSELASLATSAERAFAREEPDEARSDLRELRGRLESVLKDVDEPDCDSDE